MPRIEDAIAEMRKNPKDIRYGDLCRVCDFYFGAPRQASGSHRVYKTPWSGDPRVNIQDDKGMAKAYQVRQVLRAMSGWRRRMVLVNDRYTYRVTWSDEDNAYVGLCAEFASLSWLAETSEGAFAGIRSVVAEVASDMQHSGERLPEPIATKHYSGRFMVRIPPDQHRRLALEAAEAGISLNRLASAKLS